MYELFSIIPEIESTESDPDKTNGMNKIYISFHIKLIQYLVGIFYFAYMEKKTTGNSYSINPGYC